jgi:hypothetical protein
MQVDIRVDPTMATDQTGDVGFIGEDVALGGKDDGEDAPPPP